MMIEDIYHCIDEKRYEDALDVCLLKKYKPSLLNEPKVISHLYKVRHKQSLGQVAKYMEFQLKKHPHMYQVREVYAAVLRLLRRNEEAYHQYIKVITYPFRDTSFAWKSFGQFLFSSSRFQESSIAFSMVLRINVNNMDEDAWSDYISIHLAYYRNYKKAFQIAKKSQIPQFIGIMVCFILLNAV